MGSFLEWDFFLNGIFSWMGSFLEWDLILNGILSWMGSYLESDLFLNQIFSWMRSILNRILSWMGSFLEWDLFLNGIFSWMEYYLEWDLILNGILSWMGSCLAGLRQLPKELGSEDFGHQAQQNFVGLDLAYSRGRKKIGVYCKSVTIYGTAVPYLILNNQIPYFTWWKTSSLGNYWILPNLHLQIFTFQF